MNQLSAFFILVLIAILWIFDVHTYIVNKSNSYISSAREVYLDYYHSASNKIEQYNQDITYIQEIQKENEQNAKYKILYEKTQQKIEQLEILLAISSQNNSSKTDEFKIVKALSYEEFNNPRSLILDIVLKDDRVYPLFNAKNYAAGIVTKKNAQSIAYLNEHKACAYTVSIGKNKAAGIMGGFDEDRQAIMINYISKHSIIKKGDKVTTNGFDNIFFNDVSVGEVLEVFENDKTISASIKTFANNKKENRVFYIYQNNDTKNAPQRVKIIK